MLYIPIMIYQGVTVTGIVNVNICIALQKLMAIKCNCIAHIFDIRNALIFCDVVHITVVPE